MQYFLHTQNGQCAWWNMNCLFSVDLIPIDVRIYMFLNKTPTISFPFASFPLMQFLLIVLFAKVSYDALPWVAYSQGRASAGSRAHLVIESGPSIHMNPNFYSFRIMFILIIVRFFIICLMNGWKYEKVSTNWDRAQTGVLTSDHFYK